MIDQAHQRPDGTAARNFRSNRSRFIEVDDYQLVEFAEKDEFRRSGIAIPPRGLTILTETGYLMLVKSFTDDLAWKVQRELVNRYFRIQHKSKAHELLHMMQLTVEHEERLEQLEAAKSSQQLQIGSIAQRQEEMNGDTGYMTALAFCRRKNIPAPLAFAQKLGCKAAVMCRDLGIRTGRVPDERWGTVNSYPADVLRECLPAIKER